MTSASFLFVPPPRLATEVSFADDDDAATGDPTDWGVSDTAGRELLSKSDRSERVGVAIPLLAASAAEIISFREAALLALDEVTPPAATTNGQIKVSLLRWILNKAWWWQISNSHNYPFRSETIQK